MKTLDVCGQLDEKREIGIGESRAGIAPSTRMVLLTPYTPAKDLGN
jgi:hypothetical protein